MESSPKAAQLLFLEAFGVYTSSAEASYAQHQQELGERRSVQRNSVSSRKRKAAASERENEHQRNARVVDQNLYHKGTEITDRLLSALPQGTFSASAASSSIMSVNDNPSFTNLQRHIAATPASVVNATVALIRGGPAPAGRGGRGGGRGRGRGGAAPT